MNTTVSAEDQRKINQAAVFAEDFFHNRFEVLNPPPHRYIYPISPVALKGGAWQASWPIYTYDMYMEDQGLYGTRIRGDFAVEGDRIVVGLHWYVWYPMEKWEAIQRLNQQRSQLMQGSVPDHAEGKLPGGAALRTKVDGRTIAERYPDGEPLTEQDLRSR